MQPILYPDGLTYLIVKLCVLFLALLVWWVVATPTVV